MSTFSGNKKQKSARSNSEASSNASSPPSSVHMTNNQVANNNNNNNAPKYGTLVPNRVFVGGISSTTTESELCQLFSKYGNVKATKIIADRAGVSKGYGFVTFETDEEAKRLQLDADNIVLRERRLNIAPAIKKQPFNRSFESATSPPPVTPSVYYHNGVPYTFHNGMAFFTQSPAQAAPITPAPDPSAVYQGAGYGPSQTASQTYGPAMMYPCTNPPPMFISPQQYHPYQPMPVPNQAPQLMYTSGPSPASNQTTSSTGENSATIQMAAAPPTAPYFIPPAAMAQAPDIYYNMPPAPAQGCYGPLVAVASHDGVMHYCDMPVEQTSSNMSAEDTYSLPTPDRPLSHEMPSLNNNNNRLEIDNVNIKKPVVVQYNNNSNSNNNKVANDYQHKPVMENKGSSEKRNMETPIVSLLNLQQTDERDLRRNVKNTAKTIQSREHHQQNVSMMENNVQHGVTEYVTHNEGIVQPPLHPGSPNVYHNNMHNHRHQAPVAYRWTGNVIPARSGWRGRGVGTCVPKFPFNNNTCLMNNNYVKSEIVPSGRGAGMNSSDHRRGGGRGGRGAGGRGIGYRSASAIYTRGDGGGAGVGRPFSRASASPSTIPDNHNNPPPVPRVSFHYSSPNLASSPPLQVPQQFYPQRNFQNHYYPQHPSAPGNNALHQQQPPRRYVNGGGKKANGSSGNQHAGGNRKMKTVEGMDSGAAGDAPVPSLMHQMALTPPSSPGTTSGPKGASTTTSTSTATAAGTQEQLCAHVQAMSI